MIHRQWHTDADLDTSSGGCANTRLFFGDYEVIVNLPDGTTHVFHPALSRPHFYSGGGKEDLTFDL